MVAGFHSALQLCGEFIDDSTV